MKWSGIQLTPRNIYTRVPFSQPTPGVAETGLSPLPLTRACAPLAASPVVTEQGCDGGLRQYSVALEPINQNPFGKPATGIEISGPGLVGSPLHVATDLNYGEAQAAANPEGLIVRPEIGQDEVCLSVAMTGARLELPRRGAMLQGCRRRV